MKSYRYSAVFYPDEGSISVFFPDLPGCLTYGDDLDNAYEMAKEAMGGWLASYIDANGSTPEATPLQDVIAKLNNGEYEDPDFEREPGGFVLLVELDPLYLRNISNKAVKVNTTMPAWLKTAAEERNINFSQVLQDALKEKLNV